MNFIYETDRIYSLNEKGNVVAEINFDEESDGVVDICHTFVDDSLRGQGIAAKLMEEAVKYLKEHDKKFIATCSYAQSWLRKNKV